MIKHLFYKNRNFYYDRNYDLWYEDVFLCEVENINEAMDKIKEFVFNEEMKDIINGI